MSDTSQFGLHDAATRLGVPLRVLRGAIRAGTIPAPPALGATAKVPADWLERVQAKIEAEPQALDWTSRQKVPPFARYRGTSAWRKYTVRVHEYERFRAKAG
jgi:hypothetical protein